MRKVRQDRQLHAHVPLPRRGQRPDPARRLRAMTILASWMIRHRREIAVVHVNGMSELHVTAPGVLLARLPLIVWFQGHEQNPWDSRLGWVWRRLLRHRRLMAVSEVAMRRAVAANVGRSHEFAIVPCPIDADDVVADRSPQTTLSRSRLHLGYFGGRSPPKGFYSLPKLVQLVSDAPVTWNIFAGPGGSDSPTETAVWKRLQGAGDERVKIYGRLDDVREAYGACDAVVTMSRAESFSRTVAEAMLNGLPVIASDIEAHRALLGDEEAGLLFPVGDLPAAAVAIRRLVADEQLRRRLGEAGRVRAAAFDPDMVASRFSEFYRGAPWCSGSKQRSWTEAAIMDYRKIRGLVWLDHKTRFLASTRFGSTTRRAVGRFVARGGDLKAQTPDGLLFVGDVGDREYLLAIQAGSWEPLNLRLFLGALRPGMAVLDVGSHIGYFSVKAGSVVGPSGRVFAFEANPTSARLLRENVAMNGLDDVVSIHEVVAASDNQLVKFALTPGNRMSSSQFVEHEGSSFVEVGAVALDDVIPADVAVSAAKIDVEGSEVRVLNGMPRILSQLETLCIECHAGFLKAAGSSADELLARLSEAGFHVQVVDERQGLLRPFAARDLETYVNLYATRTPD